jgi:hypothetical protein
MNPKILPCAASMFAILLVAIPWPPGSVFAFGRWDDGHEQITQRALNFLWPGVINLLVHKNQDQDQGEAAGKKERHFDGCPFQDSETYINQRYERAVDRLRHDDPLGAMEDFGWLLHPVQDFYSHSAWVDPEPIGLGFGTGPGRKLEAGTTLWDLPGPYETLVDDIVIVEGDPDPEEVQSIYLPRDDRGKPNSAVPVVVKDGRRFRGLLTAGSGKCPDSDDCESDASVCIQHGEGKPFFDNCEGEIYQNCLHHDREHRPRFRKAFNAALVQTEHEWCRLMHLAADNGAATDYRAASQLLGLLVKQDGGALRSPHPLGTPCAHRPQGRYRLHVNLVDVNRRGGVGGLDNFSLTAFRTDLSASRRLRFRSRSVPDDRLNLCMNPTDRLVIAVWGWVARDSTAVEFTRRSEVLGGASRRIDFTESPPGVQVPIMLGDDNFSARVEFSYQEAPDCDLGQELEPGLRFLPAVLSVILAKP